MISKLRKEDEKCANIVADLLDKYLYCNVSNFERCYDVQRQVSGIDTLFTNIVARKPTCFNRGRNCNNFL